MLVETFCNSTVWLFTCTFQHFWVAKSNFAAKLTFICQRFQVKIRCEQKHWHMFAWISFGVCVSGHPANVSPWGNSLALQLQTLHFAHHLITWLSAVWCRAGGVQCVCRAFSLRKNCLLWVKVVRWEWSKTVNLWAGLLNSERNLSFKWAVCNCCCYGALNKNKTKDFMGGGASQELGLWLAHWTKALWDC